mmetsp:Transcript_9850/g.13879  ORF Transcript_9850/g.13879 Transcript_9850/m.13879 type:complete len:119 (-) Transcript_9850:45-401(-)
MSSDQENLKPDELNYRDQDDEYDSSEDEDYVPTGEEEHDDYGDEEDAEYEDEGECAEPDEASRVLDELVEMFVSNTGRAPTEEEMQEWIETMKTLVVSEGGEESAEERAAEATPSASE